MVPAEVPKIYIGTKRNDVLSIYNKAVETTDETRR